MHKETFMLFYVQKDDYVNSSHLLWRGVGGEAFISLPAIENRKWYPHQFCSVHEFPDGGLQ